MSKKDPIMQRMKANYEVRSRTYLTRRVPVIMRLDGKAFHTYTRGLDKPFDEGLIEDMAETAKYLCSEIQGAKCAYVQSDEISILITDFDRLETSAWFDYQVQKMCSVAAAIASAKFNELRLKRQIDNWLTESGPSYGPLVDAIIDYDKLAFFDCRVFNIPKEEVPNYFHARQRDAVKNSISMLAQSLYSHSELHKKNSVDMQEMCFQKGHNWNDLHYSKKRGSFIVKNIYVGEKLATKQSNYTTHGYFKMLEGQLHEQGGIIYQATKLGESIYIHEAVESKKVRSKWESVETPMKLNDPKIFKQWIDVE